MKLRRMCMGLLAVGCGTTPAEEGGQKWWLLDELGNEGEDGDDDGEDDDDDEGDWDEGTLFWGELVLDGDGEVEGGAVGLYLAEEGNLICEVEYIVTTATTVDDCSECEFAFSIDIGEEDFAEGDCDGLGLTGRTGTSVRVGQSGSALLHDDGTGWTARGEAGLDGSDWFFEMMVDE